jgi:hypothetical protein
VPPLFNATINPFLVHQSLLSFSSFVQRLKHQMGNSQSAASNASSSRQEKDQIIFGLLQSILTSLNDEKADDPRPIDKSVCYDDDGAFNDEKFQDFLDRQRGADLANMKVRFLLMQMLQEASLLRVAAAAQDKAIEGERPLKRCRRVKTFIDPTTSLARPITPRLTSHWWILYIEDPKVDDAQRNKQFRNRFRLPYDSYLDLLHQVFELENDAEVVDPF